MAKKVVFREYNSDRDLELVEKLERICEIGSKTSGFSLITSMMGDPLCRIKLYPIHVMLVAEMVGNGEVVGVIRGCIKSVGTCLGAGHVSIGCIIGLRVSPKHRRNGIGSKLVKLTEIWAKNNGAQYIFLAAEESNIASVNLFTRKLDYIIMRSLKIIIHPINSHTRNHNIPFNIKILKLTLEQAISLYKDRLKSDNFFLQDIESVLSEELSLGTWFAYSDDKSQPSDEENIDISARRSYAMLSMWKTYESYKLQIRGPPVVKCFTKILPCLGFHSSTELLSSPFGFMFLYGLRGKGERIGDMVASLWSSAVDLARDMDCKALVTELGASDPLREHLPRNSFTSSINDLWFIKPVRGDEEGGGGNDEELLMSSTGGEDSSRVFVDPRDF